jgi:hypothetical protein
MLASFYFLIFIARQLIVTIGFEQETRRAAVAVVDIDSKFRYCNQFNSQVGASSILRRLFLLTPCADRVL